MKPRPGRGLKLFFNKDPPATMFNLPKRFKEGPEGGNRESGQAGEQQAGSGPDPRVPKQVGFQSSGKIKNRCRISKVPVPENHGIKERCRIQEKSISKKYRSKKTVH